MAEKSKPFSEGLSSDKKMKPLHMKLFATWEVQSTPSNCIPRLCSLTLTRLVVIRPLGAELSTISIAVKMRSSKRILRSNEMSLPASGLLDTELDLHFALQYPHFLKRDGNQLHVMLQRRKRYKNRTILGFKTLAEGVVNMSQVLQRQMDLELDLLSEGKDGKAGGLAARVTVSNLSSQPVDQKALTADLADRFSDEEEDFASSQDDEGEGSDSEPMLDEAGRRARKQRGKIATNARQRNLKQKFISLLKRFRQNEGLTGLGPDQEDMDRKLSGGDMDPTEIEDLFEELEDLSESGPEMDTLSISSTPKPSLRPFFSSSRSLLQDNLCTPGVIEEGWEPDAVEKEPERGLDRLSDESSKGRADSDSHPEAWTDLDASDPPPSRGSRLFLRDKPLGKPKKSVSEPKALTAPTLTLENSAEPRKLLMEQLTRILTPDDVLPDHVILVSASDAPGTLLAARLQERQLKVLPILSANDLRPTLTTLVNKIQKICHSSAKPPAALKIMAIGSDGFFNSLLRQYVDQLSLKPPDWQNYIKFLIVPFGSSNIARYLASLDNTYAACFTGDAWRDLIETRADVEAATRVSRYLHNATAMVMLPIAEAMLTYKEKSSDDESCQVFLPFVSDVRIGVTDFIGGMSVDFEDAPAAGSSPPRTTPPSSPNVNNISSGQLREFLVEPLELQLDYWTAGKPAEAKEPVKGKDPNKSSLKTTFKGLFIQRLPISGEQPGSCFLVNYSTKEKKQKIMRLGKKKEKERETECKSQQVDAVSRLICSTRTHTMPLKVSIDGVEWTGVKFFQLSAQWQTHIKSLPVAIFSHDSS